MTLLEVILAMLIIAVGVAGILLTYNVAVRGSADPLVAKQALAIAEALLEEVQLAPFTRCDPDDPKYAAADPANPADPFGPLSTDVTTAGPTGCTAGNAEALGPEGGDARPFDNVNDYAGLATAVDVAGNALDAGYAATIAVAPAALNTIPGGGEALLITVSVAAPDGNIYTLEGYRTRYAPNAVP